MAGASARVVGRRIISGKMRLLRTRVGDYRKLTLPECFFRSLIDPMTDFGREVILAARITNGSRHIVHHERHTIAFGFYRYEAGLSVPETADNTEHISGIFAGFPASVPDCGVRVTGCNQHTNHRVRVLRNNEVQRLTARKA